MWHLEKFLPTDGVEDITKFDIHAHLLEQAHLVYTSVDELSTAETLEPLPIISRVESYVIVRLVSAIAGLCGMATGLGSSVRVWHVG